MLLQCFALSGVGDSCAVVTVRAGHVDASWWVSLFTYNGAHGSGASPYVTGHINVLFPWAEGKERAWVGTEKRKDSFPDGMHFVPLIWTYLGLAVPMKAWAGSMCTCASEDDSEVAPAVCVGFTIDTPEEALQAAAAKVSARCASLEPCILLHKPMPSCDCPT